MRQKQTRPLWRGLVALALLSAGTAVAREATPIPQTGLHYYALENLDTGQVEQRGLAGSNGIAHTNLIMRPNARYRNWILQAATLKVGYSEFTSGANGTFMMLPGIYLAHSQTPDSDNDGLRDECEFVMGTDPNNPDTDGDGVPDGAEVRQGQNPLDGLPTVTGILGSADTPGTAKDICAFNDLAIVADGHAGVSVFNVFNGMNPTITAFVDTPGDAVAVSCADARRVAVADGPAGLAIIDISDPPASFIARQVNLGSNAQAVVVAAGFAYVGLTNGRVAKVDMVTGTVSGEVTVGGAVQDVAVEGETLYVLIDRALRAYDLSLGEMDYLGAAALSGYPAEVITHRKRLFVGGGRAYATGYPGYDVVDVSNPTRMQRIGNARDSGPNSFKQIVLNGSGLGVAAVGVNPRNDGTHHVSLYDTSNPAVTDAFITRFETPGLARAVAIYNGLAYAADSEAGLQVMNYLSFDTAGVPPTIRLSTNFTPGAAEEGKVMRVTADVSDDVQVRNVEFYLDGRRQVTDGNFPFEYRFTAPLLIEQATFTLRARATDTGGNATWSDRIVVQLTPDATAPRVTGVSPRAGSVLGSVRSVQATFSEPIQPGTVTSETVRLTSAGPDGTLGNADDVVIDGGTLTYREESRAAVIAFLHDLPPGLYRCVVSPPLSDVAGNELAAPFAWTFRVFSHVDSDGDGVPDDIEPLLGLDPNDNDTNNNGILDGDEDFDRDGLTNRCEILMGTDPANPDTDGDGILDGAEDADNDFVPDSVECVRGTNPYLVDSDGDGIADIDELAIGSDPNNAASRPPVRVASHGVSYLNALLGQDSGRRYTASMPVSYLNALLGEDAKQRYIASAPVSYLNALLGEEGGTRFVVSPPVSYLNALIGPLGNMQFLVSPIVSYQATSEVNLSVTLRR